MNWDRQETGHLSSKMKPSSTRTCLTVTSTLCASIMAVGSSQSVLFSMSYGGRSVTRRCRCRHPAKNERFMPELFERSIDLSGCGNIVITEDRSWAALGTNSSKGSLESLRILSSCREIGLDQEIPAELPASPCGVE